MGPLFENTKRVIVVATKKRKKTETGTTALPRLVQTTPLPPPRCGNKKCAVRTKRASAQQEVDRARSLLQMKKSRALWVGKERGTGVFAGGGGGGGGGGDDDIVNLLARTYLLQCETRSLTCNATVSYGFFFVTRSRRALDAATVVLGTFEMRRRLRHHKKNSE